MQHLNLHLQQLAYLREVARSTTFSEAAARLHISQPALSQGLRELERRLGVTLFERHGRRRRLTRAGQDVETFARSILAQSEDFGERLAAQKRGEDGVLRVGMIDAVALYVLPATVRRFRRQWPSVDIRLTVATSAELLFQLASFELDLAFVVAPVDENRFTWRPLAREPLYVYAPHDAGDTPSEAEWALYPEESQTRAVVETALARLGVQPRVVLESGNPQVIKQMVALGFGWTVLPAAVGDGEPAPLRRWRKRPVAHRQLVGVRRRQAPADPLVERFWKMAR